MSKTTEVKAKGFDFLTLALIAFGGLGMSGDAGMESFAESLPLGNHYPDMGNLRFAAQPSFQEPLWI